MTSLHFNAEIKIRDGNPYVEISPEQAHELKPDWKRPLPVTVQINGQPEPAWRINMMPAGDGSFYLYLHGDVREASQSKVGDNVMVDVEYDTDYKSGPAHPMPKWFREALTASELAKKNWDALIPSRKKEILRYFSWIKTDEARDRNLERAMHVLTGNPGRFMARAWENGA